MSHGENKGMRTRTRKRISNALLWGEFVFLAPPPCRILLSRRLGRTLSSFILGDMSHVGPGKEPKDKQLHGAFHDALKAQCAARDR